MMNDSVKGITISPYETNILLTNIYSLRSNFPKMLCKEEMQVSLGNLHISKEKLIYKMFYIIAS